MLFLQYGVDSNGTLIHVSQVARGKSELHCPYCGVLLIARKGERIAHHFAHSSDTCNQASRDMEGLALPVYDNFNLHVPGRAVQELTLWDKNRWSQDVDTDYLEQHGLLKANNYKETWYDLTKPGKIILGQLSLDLFNRYQEPLILERHEKIEQNTRNAKTDTDRQMYLTDLRLYRTQMRRILACTLYFLQIGADGLYKIGVTTRNIEDRVREIVADIQPILGVVEVKVLGTWSSRGNVEFYFKHHYREQQHLLGSLTEYYQFEDVTPVLRDLRRMKAKVLSDLEREILDGNRPHIELEWESQTIEQRRVTAIKPGIERARKKGTRLGRPPGLETADDILAKPYANQVREALAAGLSLREAARAAGVALNTVQKVKAAAIGHGLEIAAKPSLLTPDDLPKGDLVTIWNFAAETYQAKWNRGWEWVWPRTVIPERLEQDGPYFLNFRSSQVYMGKTRHEVINNILYVLNTGRDDPTKRLRLTLSERRALKALHTIRTIDRQGKTFNEKEKADYERLAIKHLIEWNIHFRAYNLTQAGQRFIDDLERESKRSDSS